MTAAFGGLYSTAKITDIEAAVKPLSVIDYEDDEEVLDWLKSAIEGMKDPHSERCEVMFRNRDFYRSMQSMALGRTGIPRDREAREMNSKFSRVVVNHLYDLTEQWVSKMTRFAPAIAIIPPNNEHNDRIAAKMAKYFIDYLFYVNDFDEILEDIARQARLFGESFLFVLWNPHRGDIAGEAQLASSLKMRIPLTDSDGEQVMSADGEPLYVDEQQRLGDVEYCVKEPWLVLCQPKSKWTDVDWVIKIDAVDIDELKAEYPDAAGDLDSNANDDLGLNSIMSADSDNNEVMLFTLYHRSTRFLSSGRQIKVCGGVVLENRSLPYRHGELPVVRLTNIDIPGELHGQSFFQNLMLLQVMYNNLASLAYTNMSLASHAYWMVPNSGNVDIMKIKNSASVIKYSGGIAPRLEVFKTVGEEVLAAMKLVEEQIQKISGIHGVSRGEPPAGIEAGIALTFLEEQENQRANTDIKKNNAFIKKAARLSLSTCGQFYEAGDDRTIKIVGKNNQFSVRELNKAQLEGAYDIRVQRTTALSESKSGRLSQILALEGRFPGMLRREQVLDMLDLANDQKFYDLSTVALQAAEDEDERMFEGEKITPAEPYEEHLVHWDTHTKFIQSRSFKDDVPEEWKQQIFNHILGHEYWMFRKSKENIAFATELSTRPNFPMFLLIAPVGAPPEGAAPPQPMEGGAPTGDQPIDQSTQPEPIDSGEAPMPPAEGGAEPGAVEAEMPEAPQNGQAA